MKKTMHIFIKEFKDYFISPIAYIVISIFLLITGWFFFSAFFLYDQATLRSFFGLLPFTFSFVIPAVTMRLFSEEFSVGSYEILITLPVSSKNIVVGKFMAGTAFVMVMLISTLAYPITITFIGQLDWGTVIGGYTGALLLGAGYSAIGLFASALTKNQIIAFITGAALCFFLAIIGKILFFLPENLLGIIQYLSTSFHFQNISKGIIDCRDIVYFISIIFIALYSTSMVIDEKS